MSTVEYERDVEQDPWMAGWYPSRRNRENLCKWVGARARGGLVTVYRRDYAWRVAYDGQFFEERFDTREEAQMGARELVPGAR